MELFWTFFKIGIFTFGGGYAMIPLIENEIIVNKKWIDKDELLEIISISQMTPGPIAINAATFIGKKIGGITGSILATLGVVMPSLIIITAISMFFVKYFNNPIIMKLFLGLKAGVVALILLTVVKLSKNNFKEINKTIIFLIAIVILILFRKISPIYLILFFGVGNIILTYLKRGKK